MILQKANVQAYIIYDNELKNMIQNSYPINKRQDLVYFDDNDDDYYYYFPSYSEKIMGIKNNTSSING